jgi:hypothetical protein
VRQVPSARPAGRPQGTGRGAPIKYFTILPPLELLEMADLPGRSVAIEHSSAFGGHVRNERRWIGALPRRPGARTSGAIL